MICSIRLQKCLTGKIPAACGRAVERLVLWLEGSLTNATAPQVLTCQCVHVSVSCSVSKTKITPVWWFLSAHLGFFYLMSFFSPPPMMTSPFSCFTSLAVHISWDPWGRTLISGLLNMSNCCSSHLSCCAHSSLHCLEFFFFRYFCRFQLL